MYIGYRAPSIGGAPDQDRRLVGRNHLPVRAAGVVSNSGNAGQFENGALAAQKFRLQTPVLAVDSFRLLTAPSNLEPQRCGFYKSIEKAAFCWPS